MKLIEIIADLCLNIRQAWRTKNFNKTFSFSFEINLGYLTLLALVIWLLIRK